MDASQQEDRHLRPRNRTFQGSSELEPRIPTREVIPAFESRSTKSQAQYVADTSAKVCGVTALTAAPASTIPAPQSDVVQSLIFENG